MTMSDKGGGIGESLVGRHQLARCGNEPTPGSVATLEGRPSAFDDNAERVQVTARID